MKSIRSIIADIFIKEGDVYEEPPKIDQPTGRGGITLATLKSYALLNGRSAVNLETLKNLTRPEAEAVISWKLSRLMVEMNLHVVSFEPLRLQLLDFGYNSGGPLAIRWLQRVLNVPRDGKIGPVTAEALRHENSRLVHQALIAARLQMIDSWTDAPANKKWEEGLENRALSFSLLPIP
jgi:lysozyme family protein